VALRDNVFRDSEVRQDGVAFLVEENVGGLDVSVHHTTTMRVLKGTADLMRHGARNGQRQLASLRYDRGERAAFHVLHDEEVQLFDLADREHGDDVGVLEVGDGLCFATKALDCAVVDETAGGKHLDRDRPIERQLIGEEDGGLAAASQFAPNAVLPRQVGPQSP
jgi:hypothetical protein